MRSNDNNSYDQKDNNINNNNNNNQNLYICSYYQECNNFIDKESIYFEPCLHQFCSSCLKDRDIDRQHIYVCPYCNERILEINQFSTRELKSAREIKKQRIQKYRTCLEHNLDFSYYCMHCRKVLCDTCKYRHPSEHTVISGFKEMDKKEKESFLQFFRTIDINATLQEVKERIRNLKNSQDRYDDYHRKSIKYLEDRFRYYSKELSLLAGQLKTQFDFTGSENMIALTKNIDKLRLYEDHLHSFKTFQEKMQQGIPYDEFDQIEIDDLQDQEKKGTLIKIIEDKELSAITNYVEILETLKENLKAEEEQLKPLNTFKFDFKIVDRTSFQWLVKLYVCTCSERYNINCKCNQKIYNSNLARPTSSLKDYNNDNIDEINNYYNNDNDNSNSSSSSSSSQPQQSKKLSKKQKQQQKQQQQQQQQLDVGSDNFFPLNDEISRRSPLSCFFKIGGKFNSSPKETFFYRYSLKEKKYEKKTTLTYGTQQNLSNSCCYFNNHIFLFSSSYYIFSLEYSRWEMGALGNYGGDGVSVVTNKITESIYLIGGQNGPSNIIRFVPSDRSYTIFNCKLSPPRTNSYSISVNEKLYIIGGITDTPLPSSNSSSTSTSTIKPNLRSLTLIDEFNIMEKKLTTYSDLKITGVVQGACFNGDDLIFIITTKEFLSFSIRSKETYKLEFPPIPFCMGISLIYGFVTKPEEECVFLIGVGSIYYFDLTLLQWKPYDTPLKDDPLYKSYFHACVPIYQSEINM